MQCHNRWWLIHNEHPCPSLTITFISSESLTCPSAVCPLTHSSPWVAPEQSRACDSRLACRQSTHSQIVNPMIQAGTRLLPAPVSSLLYTLGSANGEQMQGNGRPCQLHADKQPTTRLCFAPASGLWSWRNMSDILRGLPFLKTPLPVSYYPNPKRSMKTIFHLCLHGNCCQNSVCVSACVCFEREWREREETYVVKLLVHNIWKIGG